jgi:hypothetical protein
MERFGWFVTLGVISSYILMAVCLTFALADIGITGAPSPAPEPSLDVLTVRYLSFMLAWLMGSWLVLFLLRHMLARARS